MLDTVFSIKFYNYTYTIAIAHTPICVNVRACLSVHDVGICDLS